MRAREATKITLAEAYRLGVDNAEAGFDRNVVPRVLRGDPALVTRYLRGFDHCVSDLSMGAANE